MSTVSEAGEALSSRPFRARAGQAGDLREDDHRHQSRQGQWRHRCAARDRGRSARFHPAPGLGESRFQRRGRANPLRRLHETLQLEIITVIEALGRLRESPDYELSQISERKPGVLDELLAERAKQLENESAELEQQATRLAEEIKELSGELAERIA